MGTALRFDGTNDYVRDQSNYYFNSDTDWSFGCWAWFDTFSPSSNASIMEAMDSDATVQARWLYVSSGSGRLNVRQSHTGTSATADVATGSGVLTTGKWVCLVVSYDAGANRLSVFLGDHATPAAEASYNSRVDGTSAVMLDMDFQGIGGNPNSATSRPFDGAIAWPWMRLAEADVALTERYRRGDLKALWSGGVGPSYLLHFGAHGAYDLIGQRAWTVSGAADETGPSRRFSFRRRSAQMLGAAAIPAQDISQATGTITFSAVGQALAVSTVSLANAPGTVTVSPVAQALTTSGTAEISGATGTITFAPQAQALDADGLVYQVIGTITLSPVGQAVAGEGTASLANAPATVTLTPVGQALTVSGSAPLANAPTSVTLAPVAQALVASGTAEISQAVATVTLAPQAQALSAANLIYQVIGTITMSPVGQAMTGSGSASIANAPTTATFSAVGQGFTASGSAPIPQATGTVTVAAVGQALVGSGAVSLANAPVTVTLTAVGQAFASGSALPGHLSQYLGELLSWFADQLETYGVNVASTRRTFGPPVGMCCGERSPELVAWWTTMSPTSTIENWCEPRVQVRVLYRTCWPLPEVLGDGTVIEADTEDLADDLAYVAEAGFTLLANAPTTSAFPNGVVVSSASPYGPDGNCAGVSWSLQGDLVPLLEPV